MKKRLGLLVMLLAILAAPVYVNAKEISSADGNVKVSDNDVEVTDVLNASNIDLTAAQKTAIETASQGQKVVGAYELSITDDQQQPVDVKNTDGKVIISFKLTKDLEAYDEFNLIKINDQNDVINDSEVGTEVKDGYIVTEEYADLGRIVIVACNKEKTPEEPKKEQPKEEEKKEEPKKEEEKTKVENPKTFDGVTLNVVGFALGMVAIIGGAYVVIKKANA